MELAKGEAVNIVGRSPAEPASTLPVVVKHVGLLVFLHEPDAGAISRVEELNGVMTEGRLRADGFRGVSG